MSRQSDSNLARQQYAAEDEMPTNERRLRYVPSVTHVAGSMYFNIMDLVDDRVCGPLCDTIEEAQRSADALNRLNRTEPRFGSD